MKDKVCTLLFLLRGDEILLAMKKRGFGSDRWNGVGGKIKPGETMHQALIRECQEEIGVTPTRFHKIAVHDFIMDADTDSPWSMPVHTYLCHEWSGEPAESEEMAPRWFQLSDIPYDNMWADDPYWLPQALEGKLLQTRFEFSSDESVLTSDIREVDQLNDD